MQYSSKKKYPDARVYEVGNEVHLLLPAFSFPVAYNPPIADLLIRLLAGYPDVKPDMFWTKPDVKLASGAWPAASEVHELPGSAAARLKLYKNVSWQRWSRHITAVDWRPGQGLRSFIGAIKCELGRQI